MRWGTLFTGFGLIVVALMPPGNTSSDGASMLAVATSVVSDGDLSVPCEFGIAGEGGSCYSNYYPLQSFLAAPLVALGRLFADVAGAPQSFVGEFLAQLLPALAAAGVASFTVYFAETFGASPRRAVLAGVTTLLATELAIYFRSFFAEALAALLVCACVWGLLRRDRWRYAAPVAAGLLVLAKPQLAPVGLAVAAVVALSERRWRRFAEISLGLILGGGLYAAYNVARFGDPMDLGGEARTLQAEAFSPSAALEALGLLTISPGRGFLWYSPIVLLGFYAVARMRKELLAVFAVAIFAAILAAHVGNPGSGYNWGSRYLVPAIPLLVAAAWALRGRLAGGAAIACAAAGLVIAAPTFVGYYQRAYAEQTAVGLPPEDTYWSVDGSVGVRVWGSASRQLEAAQRANVRDIARGVEPPGSSGDAVEDQRFFGVVAQWWWMTPAVGIPQILSGLLALGMLLGGMLMLKRAIPDHRGIERSEAFKPALSDLQN
jgi:hypothetical protein